jgi:hypothetical protein
VDDAAPAEGCEDRYCRHGRRHRQPRSLRLERLGERGRHIPIERRIRSRGKRSFE